MTVLQQGGHSRSDSVESSMLGLPAPPSSVGSVGRTPSNGNEPNAPEGGPYTTTSPTGMESVLCRQQLG